MKAREWSQASRPIAAALSGFDPIRFGFTRISDWWAECFYANTSAFSKDWFYLEAFVLPLFVPTSFVYFDYGFRVGAWDRVTPDVVRAVERAVPRLSSIASRDGLWAIAHDERNVRQVELRAALSVLNGDVVAADSQADILRHMKLERDWEEEIRDRALQLVRGFRTDGWSATLQKLQSTRADVIAVLR
jgi:hypothetical protein